MNASTLVQRWAALCAAGLLASCAAQEEAPKPELYGVQPAAVTGDQPAAVSLLGRNFLPRMRVDFADQRSSEVDNRFEVRLASEGLAEVVLEGVERRSQDLLAATVPAGLAQVSWDVVVVDPSGNEARLEGGLRVVRSAESVRTYQVGVQGAQRAGVPFLVQLTALDEDGQRVEGFTGTATLEAASLGVAAQQVGPFVAGRTLAEVTVPTVDAAAVLQVTDEEGRMGTSPAFPVLQGPPASLALTVAQGARVGACTGPHLVRVLDSTGGPARVEAPVEVAVAAEPWGSAQIFADPGCSLEQPRVLVEQAGTAQVYLRPVRSGGLRLWARAAALPSGRADLEVSAGPPHALDFATPGRQVAILGCSELVALRAKDAFGNPTSVDVPVTVQLEVSPSSSVELFEDGACTTSVSSAVLSASVGELGLYVRGAAAGYVRLEAVDVSGTLAPAAQEVLVVP